MKTKTLQIKLSKILFFHSNNAEHKHDLAPSSTYHKSCHLHISSYSQYTPITPHTDFNIRDLTKSRCGQETEETSNDQLLSIA
jgi:hypothetical protein